MNDRLIKIGGAGIGGLTAAINLARAGFRTKVFEKRKQVGARFWGDYQFLECWTGDGNPELYLKKLGVDASFPYKPIFRAEVFDSRLNHYSFTSSKPIMYMVRRGPYEDCLDWHLKCQALKAGVEIETGRAVKPDEVDIVATGPAKSLMFVDGVFFRSPISDGVRVILDWRIAPGGYAYMVTDRGNTLICVCYSRNHRKNGSSFLSKAVERFNEIESFKPQDAKIFKNFGIAPSNITGPGIYVGEAAGLQDINWGFGMKYAFYSGFLAAMSVIEKADYGKFAEKDLRGWLKTSASNRFLIELGRDAVLRFMVRKFHRSSDLLAELNHFYKPAALKSLLFIIASAFLRRRYKGVFQL